MKKFCLAMLALGMSLTAAATDFYVIGNNVDGKSWSLKTNQMTDKGNGVYEWTGSKLGTNFKINDGSWSGSYNLGSNGSQLEVGVAYNYQNGSNDNIQFKGVDEVKSPKVVLDTTAGTITVTGQSEEATYTGLNIYLAGEFNSYTAGDAAYKFTEEGTTGVYKFHQDSWSKNFKVVTPTGWYGTRDKIVSGTSYVLFDTGNDNCNLANVPATDVTWTYTASTKTLVVTYTSEGGSVVVPPVTDEYTYALHGQIFGNTNWSSEDMTNNDGVWSWTGDIVAGDFGMKKCQNGEQVDWIGGKAKIEAEGTYDFVAGGNSSSTLSGNYTISYNPTTSKITFTKNGGGDDPNPPVPPTTDYTSWYVNVFGPFNDWQDNGVHPDADNISFTENLEIMKPGTDGRVGFMVKTWDGSKAVQYVAAADVELNVWTQMYVDSYGVPTKIAGGEEGQLYNVYFNCATNEVKVEKAGTDAVSEVAVAEGEAVYYNLQGVQVANPVHGIYVKVANGKATKVVVK